MSKLVSVVSLLAMILVQTSLPAQEQPESIDQRATHEQVALIKIAESPSDSLKVNAFCLSHQDEILACCGNGPGEVRVFNAEGKLRTSWEVAIKPEAISVAEDGSVLVAGSGKLFRFTTDGKELKQAESPHALALKEDTEKLREQAIKQIKQSFNRTENRVEMYLRIISELEEKKKTKELNQQEEQILKFLPKNLERLKKQLAEEPKKKESKISEEQIQQHVENMIRSKMRISSISDDKDHVYIATRSLTGYAFDVWRLDHNFQNGEVVITGLRGCCGQMDVQACNAGVFVAENGRHRVASYHPSGELVKTWGKRDRKGLDGFTSCCNPMNVCFNQSGDVFTAESNTGRIKRFNADGEFREFIGDVKLVPGCKNVSIAVSQNNDRVYMLDITRNHIVLMKRKTDDAASEPESEASE